MALYENIISLAKNQTQYSFNGITVITVEVILNLGGNYEKWLETQTEPVLSYGYGHLDDNDLTLHSGLFITLLFHNCDKTSNFNRLLESCLQREVDIIS